MYEDDTLDLQANIIGSNQQSIGVNHQLEHVKIDAHDESQVIVLDVSKTFHRILHAGLLRKLTCYGHRHSSSFYLINAIIPQGSVLVVTVLIKKLISWFLQFSIISTPTFYIKFPASKAIFQSWIEQPSLDIKAQNAMVMNGLIVENKETWETSTLMTVTFYSQTISALSQEILLFL